MAWQFVLLFAGIPAIVLGNPVYAESTTFSIDPQDLDGALKAFGVQSHREIFFAPELARGKQSQGVRGKFDELKALRIILEGTGLSFSITPSGAFLIRDPGGNTGVSSSQSEGTPEDLALTEIVVTATRRSENVQNVPISITALTQSFIQNTGSQQIQDVVHAVPGLAFDPNSAGSAALSIRGVSTSSSTGNTQSPVAFYMDEVSLIDPSAPHEVPELPLFDINRIEVLRGPQGTLFGAGALGGAIRVITNKPDASQFQAAIEETVEARAKGDMSYLTHLMVNVPLIDNTLALRVVGFFDHDGGWVDNPTQSATNVNHQELEGGRAVVRWTPNDELTLTATISDEIDRPHDSAFSSYTSNSYTYTGALPQFAQEDTKIYNVVGEYKMPGATLTSSTSYTDRQQREQTDATALITSITAIDAPAPVIDNGPSGDFIQEIRLSSTSEHPYKWLVGAYFQNFHRRLAETISQAGAGSEFAALGFPSDTLSISTFNFKVHEDALFGEASYDIMPQLTLTAGARVFHETVASTSDGDGVLNGGPTSFESSAGYDKATPKVVLAYTPIKDVMFYAQAAEGYRAGQGNLGPGVDPASGQSIPSAYGPDHLWNYELGAKTTLLDRRLIVDADVYYIDWSQIQLTQYSAPSGFVYTANAGDALIRGAELQVVARPVASLELGTSLSYHDGRLTRVDPGVKALRNDQLPGSARFTSYLYGQYDFRINDRLTSFVRADFSYVGREFSDLDNPTSLIYGNYRDLGAQLGLTYRKFDFLLFASNLENGNGLVNARQILNAPTGIRQTPRTVGVTFRAHY
jgi:iron complex outermembrane recepter protein